MKISRLAPHLAAALLALSAGFISPTSASACNCSKKCTTQCKLRKAHHCECKKCDCAKSGHCGHGHCDYKAPKKS